MNDADEVNAALFVIFRNLNAALQNGKTPLDHANLRDQVEAALYLRSVVFREIPIRSHFFLAS